MSKLLKGRSQQWIIFPLQSSFRANIRETRYYLRSIHVDSWYVVLSARSCGVLSQYCPSNSHSVQYASQLEIISGRQLNWIYWKCGTHYYTHFIRFGSPHYLSRHWIDVRDILIYSFSQAIFTVRKQVLGTGGGCWCHLDFRYQIFIFHVKFAIFFLHYAKW